MTPLALVAIDHDHNCGAIVLCVPEGVPGEMIGGILVGLGRQVAAGTYKMPTIEDVARKLAASQKPKRDYTKS